MRAITDGKRGEIHVGYAPSLTVQLLPPVLREYQEAFPNVRVVLHDLSTQEMLAGLHKGRLQIALLIKPSPGGTRGLVLDELCRYGLRVAAGAVASVGPGTNGHFGASGLRPALGLYPGGLPGVSRWLEEVFANVAKATVAEEHDAATSLVAAVEAGRGIALVPESFSCFAGTRLKLRPLSPPLTPFPVRGRHRKGRQGRRERPQFEPRPAKHEKLSGTRAIPLPASTAATRLVAASCSSATVAFGDVFANTSSSHS